MADATTWSRRIAPRSRVRALRWERRLTQAGLAERAGVSIAMVGLVERHPGLLRSSLAERLAPVLGCTPDALMTVPNSSSEGAR